MGQLNQQIAEQLNEMIPSEWTKIILYAEILDDSSEVYFSSIHHKVKSISILMIYRNNSMLVKNIREFINRTSRVIRGVKRRI